tara:strand:+ start:9822 stop:10646 length:825 start_codon:yes stop_codon:yes gene_type:complete
MKNLAISKSDICLIAGSGLFVYEVANFLNNKNLLNQIILINENKLIKKNFKNKHKFFKIQDIEKIISFIKSQNLKKVLIIGYVVLPSIEKINLSIKSKLLLSKDIFLNNINDQSKILKKYLSNNKLTLLSQKKILNKMLVSYEDRFYHSKNKIIINNIKNKKNFLKKIFSMNIAQSFILNGDRVIAIEDIFGTNDMINKIGKINSKFKNLIFVKSKKSNQIDEIDFPIIGMETLKLLIKYKFRAICLFNNRIIISQKDNFLKKIRDNNISLIIL